MNADPRHLVTPEHLERLGLVYLRQSSLRQVLQNTESARRQYGLRERFLELGFPEARIVVIDCDQGRTGSTVGGRQGFQYLIAEVALGHVGVVGAIEATRLARDNADWAQLVKSCALTGTLIMDENGIYDPRDPSDRFSLGIKGPIGEQELLLIRARFHGAIRNRATRGEFRVRLPVGLIYDPQWRVVLDPDRQVQQALRHAFETFRRRGTATATVIALRKEAVQLPVRVWTGPHRGEMGWVRPTTGRVLSLLHNPRYAGAYCFGRTAYRLKPDGKYDGQVLPMEKWFSLLQAAHPGYISWDDYKRNLEMLRANNTKKRKGSGGPAREGPALLQGLVLCGMCGRRMHSDYHSRGGRLVPEYVCKGDPDAGERRCQNVTGDDVDEAVGALLVEVVTPETARTALRVREEIRARADEVSRLRSQTVERARYEVELAHRRYLRVDPENRLVASSLERDWNEKMEALARAEQECTAAMRSSPGVVEEDRRAAIEALPREFAALWRDARTPWREKKRLARLVVEDVTLVKGERITVHVRLKGGESRTLTVRRRGCPYEEHKTRPEVLEEIRAWSGRIPDVELAQKLNEKGLRTGRGLPWTRHRVVAIRSVYRSRGTVSRGALGEGIPSGHHARAEGPSESEV